MITPSTRRPRRCPRNATPLDEVEASIKRGRAEAKRRKELAAQDRSDTESTASEASIINDAKVECFARADELLLVDYFCQHARPPSTDGTAAGLLLNKIEPKDAYFYVFGVDGTEKYLDLTTPFLLYT